MSTRLSSFGLPAPIPNPDKKKRVLLVDTSTKKRDLRADVMRKFGMDVDCAANISEARSWWRADLYDLVLISVHDDDRQRDLFCEDIRSNVRPQQLAFLVGKPEYLADAPGLTKDDQVEEAELQVLPSNGKQASASAPELPQRWGILEASRKISAVRSAWHARNQAMQERPLPARDLETRAEKRSATLDQLLAQEMQ